VLYEDKPASSCVLQSIQPLGHSSLRNC
ncbi:uncharacterized protein METZ01_LOCUS476317, partial [marine metagenome]